MNVMFQYSITRLRCNVGSREMTVVATSFSPSAQQALAKPIQFSVTTLLQARIWCCLPRSDVCVALFHGGVSANMSLKTLFALLMNGLTFTDLVQTIAEKELIVASCKNRGWDVDENTDRRIVLEGKGCGAVKYGSNHALG